MNATFDFIRQNWKVLFKYTFYLIMPVCLVQTYGTNTFIATMIKRDLDNVIMEFLTSYGVMILCMFIGSALISSLVYALMKSYAELETGLNGIVLADFKNILIIDFWRIVRLMLFILFIYVAAVGLTILLATTISMSSLFLTIPIIIALLCCLIVIAMILPVYLFEKISLMQAFRKAWKLGIATFGGMLGLIIVLSLISSVIQSVTMMPWYIMVVIRGVFMTVSETSAFNSVWYRFFVFIFGLVQSYGMYLSSIIGLVGLAFQYFHAREKVEGVTIESNIDNFNTL